MFSWAAWPSSQGMPTRPFALGVAPTDLARPGDGAAGPAALLSQEQKSERGETPRPPVGRPSSPSGPRVPPSAWGAPRPALRRSSLGQMPFLARKTSSW